jgi:DNA ligase-1
MHDYFVSLGYEGLIMRKFLGMENPTQKQLEETWYKGNKNNNLIKYKKFIDDEGEIIAITSGKDREEGLAIFTILSKTGKTFECRPSGLFEQRAYYYQNPVEFIGKEYTYRYFELTDAGVPRFPVGISFRDYE